MPFALFFRRGPLMPSSRFSECSSAAAKSPIVSILSPFSFSAVFYLRHAFLQLGEAKGYQALLFFSGW